MTKTLSIVVVEKDRARAMMIVDGLREAGAFDVLVIGDETGLARRIAERNPDLVLIDAGHPSRDGQTCRQPGGPRKKRQKCHEFGFAIAQHSGGCRTPRFEASLKR